MILPADYPRRLTTRFHAMSGGALAGWLRSAVLPRLFRRHGRGPDAPEFLADRLGSVADRPLPSRRTPQAGRCDRQLAGLEVLIAGPWPEDPSSQRALRFLAERAFAVRFFEGLTDARRHLAMPSGPGPDRYRGGIRRLARAPSVVPPTRRMVVASVRSASHAVDDLHRLRCRAPGAPIVLTAPDLARHDFSAARGLICDASLRQPLSPTSLSLAVGAALRNHHERLADLPADTDAEEAGAA